MHTRSNFIWHWVVVVLTSIGHHTVNTWHQSILGSCILQTKVEHFVKNMLCDWIEFVGGVNRTKRSIVYTIALFDPVSCGFEAIGKMLYSIKTNGTRTCTISHVRSRLKSSILLHNFCLLKIRAHDFWPIRIDFTWILFRYLCILLFFS